MTGKGIPAPLLVKIEQFLDNDPDAAIKIETLINTGKLLYSTDEIMGLTGWTRGYITRLCRERRLPHIPGNPHKFMLGPLRQALEDMMVGGPFGRRKAKAKTKERCPCSTVR